LTAAQNLVISKDALDALSNLAKPELDRASKKPVVAVPVKGNRVVGASGMSPASDQTPSGDGAPSDADAAPESDEPKQSDTSGSEAAPEAEESEGGES
ncbi:MAG: hypothetical protein Q7R41_04670, partial [Phycisphaerales bacterium]|nr:hypothetical protein [Phycisphaerales bacterium]